MNTSYFIVLGLMFILYVVYKIIKFKTSSTISNEVIQFDIAVSAMRKHELIKVIESEPDSSLRRKKAEERLNKYFKRIK
jgi:amino acid permease